MQMNGLIGKQLIPGQILKLPITNKKVDNKNHIDINQVTDKGVTNLIGSGQHQQKQPKNTNKNNYIIEDVDFDRSRTESVSIFLHGI